MRIKLSYNDWRGMWETEDRQISLCPDVLNRIGKEFLDTSKEAIMFVTIQPIGKCVKFRLERADVGRAWRWHTDDERIYVSHSNVFLMCDNLIEKLLVKMFRRYQSGLKGLTMAEVHVRIIQ